MKMNPFHMQGPWGDFVTRIYNIVVVPALRELYEENIEDYLPQDLIKPGRRLLDVGCGPGHVTGLVARRYPDFELVGVDLSDRMIAAAKREFGGLPNLSFQEGDALSLPFKSESFDLALSLASIKHWPDQAKGVSELFRVLKPGGSLFIMEADRSCSRRAVRNFVRHWRWVLPPARPLVIEYFMHVVAGQGLAEQQLKDLCLQAGFTEVETEALEELPAAIARGSRPG